MENLRYVYRHFRFPRWGDSHTHPDEKRHIGQHGRATHYQRGETEWMPGERGGYTFCYIYNATTNELRATGLASCSPRDNFNYRIGRAIARGRAEKQFIARAAIALFNLLLGQK